MTQVFTSIKKFFEDPRKLYELAIGLVLLLLLTAVTVFRSLDALEMLFLDLRFQLRGVRPFPQNIVVVGVDEASLDAFGRWPWSRDKHAKLIDMLNHKAFRPEALFFDMLFEERDTRFPHGDDELLYRAQKFKSNLFMAYFFEKGINTAYTERYERHPEKEKRLEDFAISESGDAPEDLEVYDKVSLPFLELSQAAQLVFVNTPTDRDGRTRRAQLLAKYNGKIYPSADLLLALQHWGAGVKDIRLSKREIVIENQAFGRKTVPINSRGELLINFYGPSHLVPAASFLGILDSGKGWMQGKDPELLNSLRDKILMVGLTALGTEDRRTTPVDRDGPGVNLHAHTLANILEQWFLARAPLGYSLAGLWITGLLTIFCTMLLKITRCLPAVFSLILVYFGITQLIFVNGLWMDFASAGLSIVVLFIGITSFRYFTALEELKRTQAQLIQAAKLASLGEMSAGIAHEFRNILNAVNLNAEMLTKPDLPPEKVLKYGEMLKKIMTSANAILEGLLLFARQSGSVKAPGNLKKVMEETMLLLEKEMIRHQIELTVELDEVPEISFDRGQISQVLMNMVNNSRDALKDRENKQIKIALKDDVKTLRIDIEDNGSGIPPQVLKRLFQPFVTSKAAGKGTGLGLSVCHGIIRNHGGEIKVTTVQNQGTTWHIHLPKA
jgi:signal transduction histidine kinase